MTGTCPSCGVAVAPGYVKCPRCQATLPSAPRGRPKHAPGGTALHAPRFPIVAVVAPVVIVGAVVAWLALRDRGTEAAPPPDDAGAVEAAPVTPTAPAVAPPPAVTAPVAPAAPDPRSVVARLERALDRQRLWVKVELDGTRLFIRSAFCEEPGLSRTIEASLAALQAAGLTQLRCLKQSGAVVFQRDL